MGNELQKRGIDVGGSVGRRRPRDGLHGFTGRTAAERQRETRNTRLRRLQHRQVCIPGVQTTTEGRAPRRVRRFRLPRPGQRREDHVRGDDNQNGLERAYPRHGDEAGCIHELEEAAFARQVRRADDGGPEHVGPGHRARGGRRCALRSLSRSARSPCGRSGRTVALNPPARVP